MERYTKDKNGDQINYRYTKETDTEFFSRILQDYVRNQRIIPEPEVDEKILDFIVDMGFSRDEKSRKREVSHLLLIRNFALIVVPLIVALQVRSLWMDWGNLKEQAKTQKEKIYEPPAR